MHEKVKRLIEREGTGISWTDLTFNPWIGCQKIGPACDNCYAEDLAKSRLGVEWGPGAPRRRTAPGNWVKPLRWNRIAEEAGVRLTVFCASLADVFDNAVDPQWRRDLGQLIAETKHLDWMVLTKRIGNVRGMALAMFDGRPPVNFSLGVTIANQIEADRDLPKTLATKAGLSIDRLFISAEPLLGALDLRRYLPGVDLLIVGGESGKNARPMNPAWPLSLRDQCAAAEVPFHFKQWGEWFRYGEVDASGLENSVDKGQRPGLWHEWPTGNFSVRLGARKAGRHLDGVIHSEHFK